MSWRAEPSDSQMGVSCTGVVTPLIVDIRRLQFSVDDGVHCHTCDALQTSELISGTYDEAESAASFQEALQAWRQSDTADTVKQSACVYRIWRLCFGEKYCVFFLRELSFLWAKKYSM